ncbi:MAG: UDP-N-acetylglucosamine 2-epimerase (non-hydrolyzing) [Acidimicrobiales bacterium]
MRVLTVAGTRPELIRLSRLVPLLDEATDHLFVHTGQNVGVGLRDRFIDELGLRAPDRQLALPDASPARRVAAVLASIDDVFAEEAPDRLVVLGDTDSGLSAYVAARRGVPVFHLEAGNRCYDDAVPEEVNRRVIDHLSTVLMPYTHRSAGHLAAEGIPADRTVVIGNPIGEVLAHHRAQIEASDVVARLGVAGGFVLATIHRAETTDRPEVLAEVLAALAEVGAELDLPVVLPVHPRTASRIGALAPPPDLSRLVTTEPLGLLDFVHLEHRAHLVVTDSGTVQEEAAILGVPCVLARDVTERPELLDCGAVLLGGRSRAGIVDASRRAVADGPSGEVPPEYLQLDVAAGAAAAIVGPLPTGR